MIRLVSAVVYDKLQKLECLVQDDDGKLRRINVSWRSKDPKPLTSVWWQTVVAEVEEQRTQELQKKTGRIIF